jgi:hypothetical protein
MKAYEREECWWSLIGGSAILVVLAAIVMIGIWLATPPKATGKYYIYHGNDSAYKVYEYMRFTIDQEKFVTTEANKAYEVLKELEGLAKVK